jgi:hypothetical protein
MRLDNWEKLLNDYLFQVGPFEWGANDCCLFAANGVLAMTGKDYAAEYRGYKTAKGAFSRLQKNGGVQGLATKAWGAAKPALMAKRGDPVLFDSGDGLALGLCIGAKIAAVGQDGLVMLPMNQAIEAWSV